MSTYRTTVNEMPETFENCPLFLDRYLKYLSIFENQRASSVVENFVCLREFFQYIHYCNVIQEKPPTKDAHKDMDISLMELPEICRITSNEIEQYQCFLDTVSRNALSTIYKKLTYIQVFFEYLERNAQEMEISLPNGNPAQRVLKPKYRRRNTVRILSVEQINKLAQSTTGFTATRDSAIILLIASTGLSISEVTSLDRQDLIKEESALRIRDDSGRIRTSYVPPVCMNLICDYLTELNEQNGDEPPPQALFVGWHNKRLTVRGIQKRISIAAAAANMATLNITAQDLRDTAIVNLLHNCPFTQQQQILNNLGLQDKRTFLRYLNANPSDSFELNVMKKIISDSPLSRLGV